MHEPDEQGVSAIMSGYIFDNAFGADPCRNHGEMTVGLRCEGREQWFNLADLIALARLASLRGE